MNLTHFQIARLILAVAAQLVGTMLLIAVIGFEVAFYMDDLKNENNYVFLSALWLGLFFSVGFSLLSALLAVSIKSSISTVTFRFLAVPALITGSILLVVLYGSVAFDLLLRV